MMDQRKVWDSVGEDWHKYRQHPANEALDFLKNKKGLVLDIACGSGRDFADISGIIIGADFSSRMLGFARSNLKKENKIADLVQADALELPFKDDAFDSILFASSFHCIKWNKRQQALDEIRRVAKNKADIFISAWNRDQPRFAGAKKESYIPWKSKGKTYKRYYYLYTKDELESLMKKYFSGVKVFGSREKAFGKYSKNLVAVMKVKK